MKVNKLYKNVYNHLFNLHETKHLDASFARAAYNASVIKFTPLAVKKVHICLLLIKAKGREKLFTKKERKKKNKINKICFKCVWVICIFLSVIPFNWFTLNRCDAKLAWCWLINSIWRLTSNDGVIEEERKHERNNIFFVGGSIYPRRSHKTPTHRTISLISSICMMMNKSNTGVDNFLILMLESFKFIVEMWKLKKKL